MSHGSGSSPLLFRRLAVELVAAGYVVALVEHPGNHRNDDALADTDENLVRRPRHLRMAIDAVVADAALGRHVLAERVAAVGQSAGAYTALAAAGGAPWSRTGQRLAVERDPRIAALVLLTPAVFWYVPEGSLRSVTAPVLVFCAEEDALTPPWHGELVRWSVADRSRVAVQIVERAGHLSLLSELPAAAPWRDPPGFDREGVHRRMAAAVIEFLGRTLAPGG